ncbi:MAG: holo-ACP synthase [Candidatus Brocadiia bacterium]
MILGIGIDIIEIKRIKTFLVRKSSMARIFSPSEINYCTKTKRMAESFAARFAVKEAFLKAVGTGWGTKDSPKWTEIEVRRGVSGAACLGLSGKAKAIARKMGAKRFHLSISHTKDMAAAVVILEN